MERHLDILHRSLGGVRRAICNQPKHGLDLPPRARLHNRGRGGMHVGGDSGDAGLFSWRASAISVRLGKALRQLPRHPERRTWSTQPRPQSSLYNLCMSSIAKFLLKCAAPFLCASALAQWNDALLRPFVMDHRAATASPADLSFLHETPAGRDGFVRVQDAHFVKPNGKRIRFWGVHLTDWSPGSIELPAKEDTPMYARTLARYGRQHCPPAFHRRVGSQRHYRRHQERYALVRSATTRPPGLPGI